tara:strand:- start:54 stop:179 length:126 start_codon:yes stop_codon:yes gene_type:complete
VGSLLLLLLVLVWLLLLLLLLGGGLRFIGADLGLEAFMIVF